MIHAASRADHESCMHVVVCFYTVMVRGFGSSEPARQRKHQGIAGLTRKRHREKDLGVLSLIRERSKPKKNKAPPHLTATATQRNAANELSPHFLLMNQVNQQMNKVNQHMNKVNQHMNKANQHMNKVNQHMNKAH